MRALFGCGKMTKIRASKEIVKWSLFVHFKTLNYTLKVEIDAFKGTQTVLIFTLLVIWPFYPI